MNTMKKILLVASVAMLALVNQGHAQASTEATEHSYLDVLRECGAEWKGRSDKSVKGAAAWQEFRKTCTNEKGWVSKKGGRKGKGKATDDKA